MDTITDRFGATYTVTSQPMGDGMTVYYVHAGDVVVARAVLRFFQCCIDDVLVYRQADRRRGIASALYALIEAELGQPLRPNRIRSKDGRVFWASRMALTRQTARQSRS
jgi:hypothetical protein